MSFLENARSEVLQIAGHLRGGFSISKEPPADLDLDAAMLADGWIPITRAAAISGVDVKFLRESTKIVKRWPKDPNDGRTWVKAEAVEQLRRERSFSVPSAPRPQGSLGPTVVAEVTFGLNDLSAKPQDDLPQRGLDRTTKEIPMTMEQAQQS